MWWKMQNIFTSIAWIFEPRTSRLPRWKFPIIHHCVFSATKITSYYTRTHFIPIHSFCVRSSILQVQTIYGLNAEWMNETEWMGIFKFSRTQFSTLVLPSLHTYPELSSRTQHCSPFFFRTPYNPSLGEPYAFSERTENRCQVFSNSPFISVY